MNDQLDDENGPGKNEEPETTKPVETPLKNRGGRPPKKKRGPQPGFKKTFTMGADSSKPSSHVELRTQSSLPVSPIVSRLPLDVDLQNAHYSLRADTEYSNS